MGESILDSIMSMLGADAGITEYKNDILYLINSALARLCGLGVGAEPLNVTNSEQTWDMITTDRILAGMVKDYVWLDVKLKFDPPTTSFVLKSYEDQRTKDEWLIEEHTSRMK